MPDVVAQGANAGASVPLPMADALGYWWCDLVELLRAALPRHDSQPAGCGVLAPLAAAPSRQGLGDLGPPEAASQSPGQGLRGGPAGQNRSRIPPGLRAGTQSGRISLGLLEGPRASQPLSEGPHGTQLSRPRRSASHATTTDPRHCILETSRTVRVMSLYCTGLNSPRPRLRYHLGPRSDGR